jgi:hypothetical protein
MSACNSITVLYQCSRRVINSHTGTIPCTYFPICSGSLEQVPFAALETLNDSITNSLSQRFTESGVVRSTPIARPMSTSLSGAVC